MKRGVFGHMKVMSNERNQPVLTTSDEKCWLPEEIEVQVLKRFKDWAEKHLNRKIVKAVIAVPG